MRRNKGRGGQAGEAGPPHARALPAHLRASPSPEPWSGGDSGVDEMPFEPVSRQYDTAATNEPSPLGRRPQRKAAGDPSFGWLLLRPFGFRRLLQSPAEPHNMA